MSKSLFAVITVGLLGLASFGVVAGEIYFQKTYLVEGMESETIKEAFGSKIMRKEDTGLEQVSGFLSKLGSSNLGNKATSERKRGKQDYPVRCSWLGNSSFFEADILLQAKDGKYRVTISDVIDSDSGRALSKMNPKFKTKCVEQMEAWADSKHEQVKKLAF